MDGNDGSIRNVFALCFTFEPADADSEVNDCSSIESLEGKSAAAADCDSLKTCKTQDSSDWLELLEDSLALNKLKGSHAQSLEREESCNALTAHSFYRVFIGPAVAGGVDGH